MGLKTDKKRSSKPKQRVCRNKILVKSEGEDVVVTGLIATTHPDRVGDILSVNALTQMVSAINDESAVAGDQGSTRSVSMNHDWIYENDATLDEAAFMKPTARIVNLENGHKGVEVDAVINKYYKGDMTPEEIMFRVEKGNLGGFSIEFNQDDNSTKEVEYEGNTYNFIEAISDFAGVGFARSRLIANPHAVIYKEIESLVQKIPNKEVGKMSEEEVKPEAPEEEAPAEEEAKEEVAPEPEPEAAHEEEAVEEEEPEAPESKEVKVDVKEVVKEIQGTKEYKAALDQIEVKQRVIKSEGKQMNLRVKEMADALEKGDTMSFKESAARYIDEEDVISKTLSDPSSAHQLKSNLIVKCEGKGMRIVGGLQVKGTLDTASNASTYTQAPVEFADLFAPGIIDTFNNQVNFWGFLRKESHVGGISYQWKMIINKDPDSNSTFVDRDDTSVLKNFSDKNNYQTPLKVARRGVSVTDFTLRYSAPSLGDLFQLEVDLQMKEMLNDVDAALFAEMADGTGNDPLGLEAVADSAGNTTLYGFTRGTGNRLSPDTAADTYEAIGGNLTEARLRASLAYLETEGTMKQNMAIIAHPTTRDYLLNLMDGQRRFATTEAAFGFNKIPTTSFDGIPVIVDHNCNEDALYIIDTEADVIVMGMEPKLVSLAKVGAATEAYLEMHFAHVYKQPRRISMLDTLSGP